MDMQNSNDESGKSQEVSPRYLSILPGNILLPPGGRGCFRTRLEAPPPAHASKHVLIGLIAVALGCEEAMT